MTLRGHFNVTQTYHGNFVATHTGKRVDILRNEVTPASRAKLDWRYGLLAFTADPYWI